MIAKLLEWFPELSRQFILVIVQTPEKGFGWDWLWPTLLGGVLSLIGSVAVLFITRESERKIRIEEQQQKSAADAMESYYKLIGLSDLIVNIKSHIDQSFASSRAQGMHEARPFQAVGPAAGRFFEPEKITGSDVSFLLTNSNFDLVSTIMVLEQRSLNYNLLMQEFTKLKLEFLDWLDALPVETRRSVVRGTMQLDLPDTYDAGFRVRAGQMDDIINGMMGTLPRDIKEAEDCLKRFRVVVFEKYGVPLPDLKAA